MKERPILFSAPMVRALLAGTKTQTRRVVKGLSEKMWIEETDSGGFAVCYDGEPCCATGVWDVKEHSYPIRCPYGAPGDRLWVREAHAPRADCLVSWQRSMTEGFNRTQPGDICYRADESARDWVEKWRPSIHMPRWASRLTLEVTEVRVERLQDISEADCWAEGVEEVMHDFDDVAQCLMAKRLGLCIDDAKPLYAQLWESINGPGSWDANPWVWCVSFPRIT